MATSAAANEIAALRNALRNCRWMREQLANVGGTLDHKLFSTSGEIPDATIEGVRAGIGFQLQSLVQNIRAVKEQHPIAQAHPNIHYKLKDQISRRNWLAHEYGTTFPVRWQDVADSIFNDVPVIESAIIAALKANGVVDP
ncbi:uncharacterized protein STEHIDRAFT_155100 [Stereum hirsutum FP-91666 SS1]|uniref:uncharacterized protein n=1 Tax=Stereum hirsutum (strain FP-91666) TaxID=721885 RepID=UPI000440CAD8|nr:uncharacterized protein STEHIDRAFT_155100 [Stereum hirsutum FP-91666 SS1]EIM87722.1 hypothetical protein STEHIDRAFT_155100 [Stereum hirsutum FP-91666 SS1]